MRADAERPLSAKGARQSERLGRLLAALDEDVRPDLLIASPKIRALETARIVAEAIGARVVEDARVAGPLDLDAAEAVLRDAGDPARPCLVGHDPDFSDLLAELLGVDDLPMKKGAWARIAVDRPLRPGGGVLRAFVPPDVVP